MVRVHNPYIAGIVVNDNFVAFFKAKYEIALKGTC
jgi:hypothetical protein